MTLPVFYDERMVAKTTSFSPSAAKPRLAVEDWLVRGLGVSVRGFRRATTTMLRLAHDPLYVDGIMRLRTENGFGNTDADVARSLPWTVGSMVAAARYVRRKGPLGVRSLSWPQCVACSPTSGFHHAGWSRAHGFCTFNGLVIAAIDAIERGAEVVDIIDCDYHYGDGTADILARLGVRRVRHHTAGERFTDPRQAGRMLSWLRSVMNVAIGSSLILYQAGADQHVGDPLGGLLTDEQIAERDRIVFRRAAQYDVPLVWNLAGGYRRDAEGGIGPVLATHRITLQMCLGIEAEL